VKLRNLIENELTQADVRQAAEKNLVAILYSMYDWPDVYIITDVPKISREQFDKLNGLSLGSRSEFLGMFNDEGIRMPSWFKRKFEDGSIKIKRALTWKQLVAHVKTVPLQDDEYEDDFDE